MSNTLVTRNHKVCAKCGQETIYNGYKLTTKLTCGMDNTIGNENM